MNDTMKSTAVVVPVVANTPHQLPSYSTADSAGQVLRAKI